VGDAIEGPVLYSNMVEKNMMDRITVVIFVGIAAAVAVGVAGAVLVLGDEDDGKFTLAYHKNGVKVSESTVSAGAYITIAEERGGPDRFIGWNTRADMSGKLLLPGTQLKMDGNASLYAMMAGPDVFVVILPEKRDGFIITADPLLVNAGGSSIITFSLMPSHVEEDLVIAVNGNPMKLDATKRIHLTDITEDKYVTVHGVYDRREHSISLPSPQTGYVLTSSAEKVHHRESYTLEYRLLPGYRETSEFGIHVSGVDSKMPVEGTVQIEDVRDNHKITVTGVEPITYSISAGKNVHVTVNGAAASGATVEDIVSIKPADGYSMPATFNVQIQGRFKVEGNGYRIFSDVTLPPILRITAGDNVRMDGASSKTVFVCPEDPIKVSAASGYSLPDNYNDKVKSLNGARQSAGGFLFSNDTTLPSVYKVVFNGHNKVHATFFVVGGALLPQPHNNPERVAYTFEGWNIAPYPVISDLFVSPIWSPMIHDVFFGPNLLVDVGGILYSFEGRNTDPPLPLKVKSDEKVIIKNILGRRLPDNYGPQKGDANFKDGYYEIIENCSFPGVTYVYYMNEKGLDQVLVVRIGNGYVPISKPNENREGFVFIGWTLDNKLIGNQINIENRDYYLFASWREINS